MINNYHLLRKFLQVLSQSSQFYFLKGNHSPNFFHWRLFLPISETQKLNHTPSVQFSLVCSVVSDSLRSHGLQLTKPPCPSPTPQVYSNSCPLSWWCDPTISSSVIPLSSCPQTSQHQGLFKWVSSLHKVAKVLEFQLQHQSFQWSALGWTGWISLQSKGLSRVFSNTNVQKHQFFGAQLSL